MSVVLTRAQVRLVDRLAVEQYGMSGLVLMENAGRNAASIIDEVYGPGGRAIVCCGAGNNGGDGFVIARHLSNAGWSVRLLLAGDPAKMTHDTRANHGIADAMALPITVATTHESLQVAISTIHSDEVVIDSLLGTGFTGEVRSPTAELILAINAADKRSVVAIDVPSGLDCDTGEAAGAVIRADLTVTFVAGKPGFEVPGAAAFLGRIEIADIGAPRALLSAVLARSGP